MLWSSAGHRGCVGLLRCWSVPVSPRTVMTHRVPVDTSRTFSISAAAKCRAHGESQPPVRQWALAVSPFSSVRAQLSCSISVSPLDPHDFPEADRAFITVRGADSELEVGLHHLHVHYDEHSKELLISAKELHSNVSIDVSAPIKSSECLLMMMMMMVMKLYISTVCQCPLCFCQIFSLLLMEKAMCK